MSGVRTKKIEEICKENQGSDLIDFMTDHAQSLWREQSKDRLVKKFAKILKDLFGVKKVSFMEMQGKGSSLSWKSGGIEFSQGTTFSAKLLGEALAELKKINLGSTQYWEGTNTLAVKDTNLNFAIVGEQMSVWHMLLWEVPKAKPTPTLEKSGKKAKWALQDFLVRQLQNSCVWLGRLDKTQALLHKDDLTGLYNYRYLEICLDSEIRRVQRFETSFCLLFIDLDNFKPINDKYGHLVGSEVIKTVADVIKLELRQVDSVFRYGGDEYVVLLLGANSAKGLTVADRIRRRIAETNFPVGGGKHTNITASIGVAACPENGVDKEVLLGMADKSMYRSKKAGKNRVAIVD